MDATRRRVLIGAGGLLPLGAVACASSRQSLDTRSSHPTLFDFTDPTDNLTALVKVMGNLNGAPTWLSAQGRIYAVREGEMPLPILGVEGVRRMRFEKTDAGYKMITRDWAFYKDVVTGEPLSQFNNPITRQINKVSPILTRPFSWEMTPDKGQQMPEYTGEAYLIDRPLILPWVQEGDQITLSLELLVRYSNGIGGGEWENFLTQADELNDPNLTSVSMRQVWTGHSPWMRWMEMGDHPGRTLWQSSGRKHGSIETLRPEFLDLVNRTFPGSLERPESYEKPKPV